MFGQVVAHGFGMLQAGQIGGRMSKKSAGVPEKNSARMPSPVEVEC